MLAPHHINGTFNGDHRCCRTALGTSAPIGTGPILEATSRTSCSAPACFSMPHFVELGAVCPEHLGESCSNPAPVHPTNSEVARAQWQQILCPRKNHPSNSHWNTCPSCRDIPRPGRVLPNCVCWSAGHPLVVINVAVHSSPGQIEIPPSPSDEAVLGETLRSLARLAARILTLAENTHMARSLLLRGVQSMGRRC